MELIKSTVKIGLEKPVKLLHVTDSHIALADERDDARKHELAKRLMNPNKEIFLREHIAYAEENCDLLVHTGDLMDFVSHANADYARALLKNEHIFFIAGNHDYSQYVGEAWEDDAYRMNSYMQMGGLGVPMFFNARVVGGVNIVGIDNSYYRFADWQLWRLKKEVEKGLPVVLAFHDPLFEQSLYDYHFSAVPHEPCTYLVGCDEEHLLPYSEFRAVQQRPDEPTLRFIDYVKNEPAVRAILTGHLHFSFESLLTPTLPQFVTGGYDGVARELTIL
ncbi:MAG: metallophosphoesterase [Clostridia bacterium]|nr:metallophosphoesterase [Clostridia bacterium]